MTESRAVVPADDGKLTLGQTALRPGDLVPPRVKVAQQMSKEVAAKKAEAGDFYNTLTGENYGPKIRIQPILPFMQRIFLVREGKRQAADELLAAASLEELSEGDGLKCRSFDMIVGRGEPGVSCEGDQQANIAPCPLSEWTKGPKGEQRSPLCTETYNVAASNELGELVIISFSRSSAKIGKRFFSALRMRPGQPWTSFYDVATSLVTNDLGNFFVPDFTISKEVPDTALLQQAIFWATQLNGVRADALDVTPDEELAERDHAAESKDPDDDDAPF